MRRNSNRYAALAAAGLLIAAMPAFSSPQDLPGQGQAVITVLGDKNAPAPAIGQQDLSVKVDGKQASITRWKPFNGSNAPVELVILIDGAARTSLGTQMEDIEHFVQGLPANTSATIAYMENGQANLSGPLTLDRSEILRGLHIPSGGVAGISASPYFCLSNLAQRWPSNNRSARREVVMITDGVDYYDMRFDPEDPYVQAAMTDATRAQLIVYSIYWRNLGRADRSMYETDAGQNLLTEVTQATGGNSYWQGYGDPVSLQPYFEDIERRLNNQYELGFMSATNGKPQVVSFKLKTDVRGAKIDAPQQVLVFGSEMAREP